MDGMQWNDVLLHIDQYLGIFVQTYGAWVYVVLFLIIFCETGLVIFPFLPGDTLLFIAGALCATGSLNLWALFGLLTMAAIVGDALNYGIGHALGQKILTQNYRWIDRKALQKTHDFYENYGKITIVLARFIPVVRTYAPFVAGISTMTFTKFQWFNVIGALIWVIGLVTAGYFFGNIPFIRDNLSKIVLLGIAAAVVPLLLGGTWRICQRWRQVKG